jgi:hypothetical protein
MSDTLDPGPPVMDEGALPALTEAEAAPGPPAAAEQAAEPAAEGGLTADEERQLGELQARRDAASSGPPPVRIKVEAPHSAMTFGGVTVGTEFQDVPARLAADMHEAAIAAGVTLTQEE